MQPTPSRRTPRTDANAVSQNTHLPRHSPAGPTVSRGGGVTDLNAAEQSPGEADGASDTLDEVARREREDMRPRLRDELGREPTEEELDEWLRRHTEGY